MKKSLKRIAIVLLVIVISFAIPFSVYITFTVLLINSRRSDEENIAIINESFGISIPDDDWSLIYINSSFGGNVYLVFDAPTKGGGIPFLNEKNTDFEAKEEEVYPVFCREMKVELPYRYDSNQNYEWYYLEKTDTLDYLLCLYQSDKVYIYGVFNYWIRSS